MKKMMDLGNEKVVKLVFKLAIPAMIAQFVNVFYGIVDRIYVGNIPIIGDMALGGIGVCGPITTLITSFAFIIGLGGAPLLAMSLGEKKEENAKRVLSNSFLMLLIITLFITGLMFLFKEPLLMTFGASETLYPYANTYLTYYLMGTLFSIVSLGLNQFIIAQGYSKIAMFTTLIGAICNIILDPIFIFTFKMDVAGAAIATIISQGISFAFVIFFLTFKSKVRISFGNYNKKIIKKILKLGFSPFLIMATDSFIIILLNGVLQSNGGSQGDTWITISTIVQSFMSVITMPLLGISSGTQPILSYNYGAKNVERIKKSIKVILMMCVAFTTIMFSLSFFIALPFTKIFTSNEEIIRLSGWGISVYMIGIIPLAFQYAFVDSLTGLGQAKYAVCLSLFRKVGVLFIATLVLPQLFGVQAAFFAEPLADVLSAIVSSTVFVLIISKILHRRVNDKIGNVLGLS